MLLTFQTASPPADAVPGPGWSRHLTEDRGFDTIQLRLYYQVMAVSLSEVDLCTLSRVGTALADGIRRRILIRLLEGPAYPADLAEYFDTSRANLSNHLTCLRGCGLVIASAEGRRMRYELADARLGDALRILAALDLPGRCDR